MGEFELDPLLRIARSALSDDALATRSLVADWLSNRPQFSMVPRPVSDDQTELALSAALVELLASRFDQAPPAWAAGVGPAPSPRHLLRSALTMRRLSEMCEAESPLPLRRRRFYAPANYLQQV